MMQVFYFTFLILLSLLGFGSAFDCPASEDPECPSDDDYIDPKHPLPDYLMVHCTGKQVLEDSRIKTMARLMDWCYCGNYLNPNGLEYAGFSVYEDGVDLSQRNPSRTWVCTKNKYEPCNAVEDWYNAVGNITRDCGQGWTGWFYDTHRQMAWGFETYQDKTFCENVGWVSSAT